jgi:hypothetical protein
MTEKKFRKGTKSKPKGKVALKDFHIFHPPHADIQIKQGESLAEIPKIYHNNLIAEGVLKG